MLALQLPQRARDRRAAAGSLLVVAAIAGLLAWSGTRSPGSSRPAAAGPAFAPSLVGQTYADARRRLAAAGLRAVELGRFSSEPAGVVLSQDTPAGARLVAGATIVLTVSKGTARSAMPELTGATARAATVRLRALQLAVLPFTVISDAPAGTVVSTFPAPGAVLAYGDQARLNLSGGIPAGLSLHGSVRVPDLAGRSAETAQARLRTLGLTPELFYVRSARAAGVVAGQSASAWARLGTIVGLGVSLGPVGTATTPVPYVVGRSPAAAASLLRSTGFRVQLVSQRAPDGAHARTILDEQPMGGTKAPPHAVVTIVTAA